MWPDLINGTFEFAGAAVLWLNVIALARDGSLKGVHWAPTVFFTTWGLWNLFYYPHLEQWFSFGGGLAIVFVNIVWLCMLGYFWAQKWRPGL